MPTVPLKVAPTEGLQPQFTARADASAINADTLSVGTRQDVGLGNAVQSTSNQVFDVQAQALKDASDLRVSDAVNQARQAALDAAYDPKTGYLNLKGQQALVRPNGLSLVQEYGQKFDKSVGDIENSLSTPDQKALFKARVGEVAIGLQGDIQKHTLSEYTDYNNSVADGTIKLSTQEAGLNWNNPKKIDNAINGIKDPVTGQMTGGIMQAVYNKGKLDGKSADEIIAMQNEAASQVHANVVETALTNNNVTYGSQYFNDNKSKMTASDILKVQGQINTQMDAHVATTAVAGASSEFSSAFQPDGLNRLTSLVKQQESNGQRFAKDGSILVSPKGAMGEMQVTPTTAADPGFGIKPADPNNLDDVARVGREYIPAMLKHYGDVGKALAAYNAGPGAVDDAIKAADAEAKANGQAAAAPNAYLLKLPQETQNYVANISQKFANGGGVAPTPTKLDFVNNAIAKLGDNPRPEALKLTRDSAEKQYDLLLDSKKTNGENALQAAQTELLNNGNDMSKLLPATRSALVQYDPDNLTKIQQFSTSLNAGVTDPEAFATASLHPDELAKMSEPLFQQFLITKFDAADRKDVINMRKDALSGTSDNSITSLNSSALNTALEGRLASIGVAPNPKKTDTAGLARVGQIQRFIRADLYAQQQQVGHKLSPEEIDGRLDKLFNTSVELKGYLWNSHPKLLTMGVSDIPSADYGNIKNALRGLGNTNPSDDLILRTYMIKKGREVNGQ